MDKRFRAFRIHREEGRIVPRFENITLEDLSPGEVLVRTSYSSVNFKDALAATGAGKILRRFPLVGGIDASGVVESSEDARYSPGDPVVITGCGLGEERDGGYAEYLRVDAESVVPIPPGLDEREVMIFGTAGFTAGLAVVQMEHNGLEPERGPVLVTGASGGVGSFAVSMLAGRGYEVTAVTGKPDAVDYLTGLGATNILLREEIEFGTRPLERVLWAGAVDNVGGEMLAWITRTTGWWGCIASVGLAGGHELRTTVMPFILRGVNLLGINSVATPRDKRLQVWDRLAGDLKPARLEDIATRSIPLAKLSAVFDGYLEGAVTGRTLVRIRD